MNITEGMNIIEVANLFLDTYEAQLAILAFYTLIFLYLLPVFMAIITLKSISRILYVAIITIFLGWTVKGWGAAYVLAVLPNTEDIL